MTMKVISTKTQPSNTYQPTNNGKQSRSQHLSSCLMCGLLEHHIPGCPQYFKLNHLSRINGFNAGDIASIVCPGDTSPTIAHRTRRAEYAMAGTIILPSARTEGSGRRLLQHICPPTTLHRNHMQRPSTPQPHQPSVHPP